MQILVTIALVVIAVLLFEAGAGWRRLFRSELVERRDREEENPFETISLYCSL